jgi:glutathione synthase/RimK-type ligase-like ATP-grasp enzyme
MKIFLISPKNVYVAQRLQEEALKQGIELHTQDIKQVVKEDFAINPAEYDALYIRQAFTDLTRKMLPHELEDLVGLAARFKKAGKAVVDENICTGDIGRGKYQALLQLAEANIKIPHTRLLSEIDLDNKDMVYPLIAKWNFGSRAEHVFLIKDANQFAKISNKYPPEEILIQEYIKAEYEYKVFTVGYKSLPLVLRLPINHNKFLPDLRKPEVLSKEQAWEVVELAEKSSRILGRELAKTDILEAKGHLYILEVNRRPGFRYFEQKTKYNVAKDFINYVCQKAKDKL